MSVALLVAGAVACVFAGGFGGYSFGARVKADVLADYERVKSILAASRAAAKAPGK